MNPIILESCVSSLAEAILAEQNGANRLELCARLDLDGLTPASKLVTQVLDAVQIPVKVMIRSREGDFTYTSKVMQDIKKDIDLMKACGVTHFVFGSITNKILDLSQLELVTDYIEKDNYPLSSLTIHKAIDTSQDILGDIARLLESSFYKKASASAIQLSILTSGGDNTAIEGSHVIRQMIDIADNRIEIIAAGQITHSNLHLVQQKIGGQSYHGRRIVAL